MKLKNQPPVEDAGVNSNASATNTPTPGPTPLGLQTELHTPAGREEDGGRNQGKHTMMSGDNPNMTV